MSNGKRVDREREPSPHTNEGRGMGDARSRQMPTNLFVLATDAFGRLEAGHFSERYALSLFERQWIACLEIRNIPRLRL